ncbi:MAG: tRNA pseudouridine(55) synthase TruB, partial [Robiginitomaculum sp.]
RKKKGRPISGWVVLDKPVGIGSTQCVSKIKWLYKAAKAGHAGTLDPLASGMLPIALGEATKTVPFVMDGQKTYLFTVTWGGETNTDDLEGVFVNQSEARPSEADIVAIMPDYMGDVEQIPPAYSAIKIDGVRAYKLARDGEEVEIDSRIVEIYTLEIVSHEEGKSTVFQVECGKGTYVRSLMRDIAVALGAHGHVVRLRRTRVGPFEAAQAIGLEALEERATKGDALETLKPLHSALADLVSLSLGIDQAQDVRHGREILLSPEQQQAVLARGAPEDAPRYAHLDEEPIAIGRQEGVVFKPVRVFNKSACEN